MPTSPFRSFMIFPSSTPRDVGPTLQWTMDPVFRPIDPYLFILEKSETPTFSPVISEQNVGEDLFAIDANPIMSNMSNDMYYRVKLRNGDRKVYYSSSLVITATPTDRHRYAMAAEITRKEFLRMRKMTGYTGFVLKRKTVGAPSDDVDPVSGVAMADSVGSYGTGIAGGYYNPLPISFSIEQRGQNRAFKPDGNGIIENYDVTARFAGFPNLVEQDKIIVKELPERFNVTAIETTFFPGTSIQIIQMAALKLIPSSDTIYSFPVPL